MLVSDAAQKAIWPDIKKHLKKGDAVYFSHGFSIVYKEQTGVIPPKDVDVIMVAPKGSGLNVRRNFLSGAGINSSFAVEQDATGRARERALALGIAVGSGYLFPTTFQKEVYSDLTGERGVLMGALAGIMDAQYEVLRANGHSPSEAFNETVEELTQSLIRLVDENGMDWMYSNCSATAQRGALDWRPRFKSAVLPVFHWLYDRVASGKETARVLESTGGPNYQELLGKELAEMGASEMWRAGKATRALRPKQAAKAISRLTPRAWVAAQRIIGNRRGLYGGATCGRPTSEIRRLTAAIPRPPPRAGATGADRTPSGCPTRKAPARRRDHGRLPLGLGVEGSSSNALGTTSHHGTPEESARRPGAAGARSRTASSSNA